MRYREVEVTSQ